MLKNYLVVAIRSILKNRIFSFINIMGLAVGLSACFLIWQYVRFESSYDQFNINSNRIYRVVSEMKAADTIVWNSASSSAATGPAMRQDFPEVEQSCRMVKTALFTGNLTSYVANALEFSRTRLDGSITAFNEERVWFTDPNFLSMFTFPLVDGTGDLTEPNTVVLTEHIAKKYFGDESAFGKEMQLNRGRALKVVGVIKDVPENSHVQFDILISFSSMMPNFGDGTNQWFWSVFYTYVMLSPEADAAQLESKLPKFIAKYKVFSNPGYKFTYQLQPIRDIHLKSHYNNEQSINGDERTVQFLSMLAFFILAVAAMNYVNIATAKALERAREVGLRKIVGAARSQLVIQFLVDALVITVLSLSMTCIVLAAVWKPFESLFGLPMNALFNNLIATESLRQLPFAVAYAFGGALLFGIYPALAISSFSPLSALKGQLTSHSTGVKIRKFMIGLQFLLATLLIAGTTLMYLQLSFMDSQDAGFTKEGMLVVRAPAVYDSNAESRVSSFRNQVAKVKGVRHITASSEVPGRVMAEYTAGRIVGEGDRAWQDIYASAVDQEFFKCYGIKLLEGRLFTETERMPFRIVDPKESIPIVVNQEFLRRLGIASKTSVGTQVVFAWGPENRSGKIVGIVADHHQLSFKDVLQPVMYIQPSWGAWKYFSVKLESSLIGETLAGLQHAFSDAFPTTPFSYFYLDDFFRQQYQNDERFKDIFVVFTILAIVVTCMGLLGLSFYSVSKRTKEMGVRKVLGASPYIILRLFANDFVVILVVSYLIALPVIYVKGTQWLQGFQFHINLNWIVFTLPVILLFSIAMITIGITCLNAMFQNPIRALRHE